MDVSARRVLPGNLLRRSRVLSAIRPNSLTYHTRVSVTGCAGEEVVLFWRLGKGEHGAWHVESVALDAEWCRGAAAGPSGVSLPHPRLPPEAVVIAQLRALRDGDAAAAEAFVLRCAGQPGLFSAGAGRAIAAALAGSGIRAELGRGALPSQRRHLQEVVISREDSTGEGALKLVWGLSVQADGCWMVESISR